MAALNNLYDMTDQDFRNLLEQRFIVVEIPRDGNCMYNAIAQGITGRVGLTQAKVREDVYFHIVKNYYHYRDLFQGKTDLDIMLQIGRILDDQELGHETALKVASSVYEHNITVFVPPGQQVRHSWDQRFGRNLFLSFHNGSHYNLLIERQDGSTVQQSDPDAINRKAMYMERELTMSFERMCVSSTQET